MSSETPSPDEELPHGAVRYEPPEWLANLPPVSLFAVYAALGHWLSLDALGVIVFI